MSLPERVAVIGAGSWGTALAMVLASNGIATRLWGRDPKQMAALANGRVNTRYLADAHLEHGIAPTASLADALSETDGLVLAVPSAALVGVLKDVAAQLERAVPAIIAVKGLEPSSLRPWHDVAAELLGDRLDTPAVLSGPSFAREVAQGQPTAVTMAAQSIERAHALAAWFHNDRFRVYASDDVIGVELGGALKNVLAIAAGISDGLGFGANARAALVTRGLAEITRLGVALGARADTFVGLAGLGDLLLTCTDDQSRNRRFGLLIASGVSATQACQQIGQAVEGIRTTEVGRLLAQRAGIDAPIIGHVYAVLHEGLAPLAAVEALLNRPQRTESPPGTGQPTAQG